MAIIRASCPDCGDVEMSTQELFVILHDDAPSLDGYTFRCPSCSVLIHKRAESHIVDLLVSSGVTCRHLVAPKEPHHPGPPLTVDDLIDLHNLLESLTPEKFIEGFRGK